NPGPGLYLFNSSGATGTPSEFGYGLVAFRQSGNLSGSFAFWKSTAQDRKIMFNTGSSAGWDSWQTIASEEHTEANYLKLGSSAATSATFNGDVSTLGTGLSYITKSVATNTPSWATNDGVVLTVKGASNRQLWLGRLGEVGIRGGTGAVPYTDDWIQLALKSDIPSLANYVTTNSNQVITGEKSFPSSTYFNSSSAAQLIFQKSGANRWRLGFSTAPEPGGNTGSNFVIHKVNDGGTPVNSIEID